jgi:Cdc6-like AAA superfamily ATPase
LNKNIQEIIDLIANKNAKEAKNKLVVVSDDLDELIDHSELDEELVEISRYQVLLNQLQQKIVALNGHIE